MKLLKMIFVSVLITIFISCDGDDVGPCEHTIKEPVLHITSIRDTLENKSIKYVLMRDLKINGYPQKGEFSISKSYGIVANDSVYHCNIPFGFGYEEGDYEFILEAEGYGSKKIILEDVEFSIFEGGCPSYNDGGKRIELSIN